MIRPASLDMRRPPTWSTRLARAALIALVPLTMFVQAAFAHSSPVYQTFRNGVTLTSFSGTFEVIWPSQIYVAGAEIELRDEVNSRLLQATEGTAVEADVPCPEFGDRYRCARIRLTDIPVLAPGSYVMYWRVVHFDEYIEQRTIRFTIDPAWVPPTPTPSVSPTPTPTPSATAAPSATPSATPAPTLGPSPASSDTPAPSTASPDSSPSASPEVSPSGQPTPSPSGGGAGGDEDPQPNLVFAAVAALLLLSAAALGFTWWGRGGRATPPRQD